MKKYEELKAKFREVYKKMLINNQGVNLTKKEEMLMDSMLDEVMDLLDSII